MSAQRLLSVVDKLVFKQVSIEEFLDEYEKIDQETEEVIKLVYPRMKEHFEDTVYKTRNTRFSAFYFKRMSALEEHQKRSVSAKELAELRTRAAELEAELEQTNKRIRELDPKPCLFGNTPSFPPSSGPQSRPWFGQPSDREPRFAGPELFQPLAAAELSQPKFGRPAGGGLFQPPPPPFDTPNHIPF